MYFVEKKIHHSSATHGLLMLFCVIHFASPQCYLITFFPIFLHPKRTRAPHQTRWWIREWRNTTKKISTNAHLCCRHVICSWIRGKLNCLTMTTRIFSYLHLARGYSVDVNSNFFSDFPMFARYSPLSNSTSTTAAKHLLQSLSV